MGSVRKWWNRGTQGFVRSMDGLDRKDAISWRARLILVGVLLLVLPTRQLSLFTHPNFYAEDGQTWFRQAYAGGWLHSLLLPEGGYLNTLQRLLTGVALLLPFHLVPLADVLMGLLVQVLPVPVLLSARCRSWGPLSVRCLFAGTYAFFPGASECYLVLTNAQWHMAIVLVLLAFADAPTTRTGRVLDVAFFLLAGVCGPFGIVLVPLMMVFWLVTRPDRLTLVKTACLAVGSLVQVFELLHGPARYRAFLGATVGKLLRMLGGETFLFAVAGVHPRLALMPAAVVLGLVIGFGVIGYAMRYATWPLRGFALFSALSLMLALHAPLVAGPLPLWDMLLASPQCRYWYFPGLVLLWAAAWCARRAPSHAMRWVGATLVFTASLGAVGGWRFQPFPDLDFPHYARQFEAAAPGTVVRIPILPFDINVLVLQKR